MYLPLQYKFSCNLLFLYKIEILRWFMYFPCKPNLFYCKMSAISVPKIKFGSCKNFKFHNKMLYPSYSGVGRKLLNIAQRTIFRAQISPFGQYTGAFGCPSDAVLAPFQRLF